MTLYSAGVVFIVLIGTFLTDLTGIYNPCIWMGIAAAALTPLTWNECQFYLLVMSTLFFIRIPNKNQKKHQ